MFPPDSSWLIPQTLTRIARRAGSARRRLEKLARSREEREALRALAAVLPRLRGDDRREFYLAPETRGWISAAEEALELAEPPADPLVLFDRAARGPYLAQLVPKGRIDAAFHRRARALGTRLVRQVFRRLPPVLAFRTPAKGRFGPFRLDLEADGHEARAAGEVHLSSPVPGVLRAGADARMDLLQGGIRVHPGAGAGWRPRPLLSGTGIVLARRVRSSRSGLRTGATVPGLADRLSAGLGLVRDAWPEMYDEVRLHTREVVPLVEPGTVSFSLPSRPGTSYINVEGKRIIDLADDLVHETAHHRLHSLEQLTPLHRAGEEALYYSPWRRSMRPLQGILHATYTFSFRAELFRRLGGVQGRLPRAWLQKEGNRERAALRRSLVDLADAADQGLLTPSGIDLIDGLQVELRS